MTDLRDRLMIRPAQSGDLGRVAEIYNAGIAERVATFETAPRTVEDIKSWVEDGHPFIVAIDNDDRRLLRPLRLPGRRRARRIRPPDHPRSRTRTHTPDQAMRRGRTARAVQAHQPRVHRQRTQPGRARRRRVRGVGIQRRHGKLNGQWKDCVLVEHLLGPAAD